MSQEGSLTNPPIQLLPCIFCLILVFSSKFSAVALLNSSISLVFRSEFSIFAFVSSVSSRTFLSSILLNRFYIFIRDKNKFAYNFSVQRTERKQWKYSRIFRPNSWQIALAEVDLKGSPARAPPNDQNVIDVILDLQLQFWIYSLSVTLSKTCSRAWRAHTCKSFIIAVKSSLDSLGVDAGVTDSTQSTTAKHVHHKRTMVVVVLYCFNVLVWNQGVPSILTRTVHGNKVKKEHLYFTLALSIITVLCV